METNHFGWWNFLKQWATRNPMPNTPNQEIQQEMRVLPQWVFVGFDEKKPYTAHIIKKFPMGVDAGLMENKAERITAPPHSKNDHIELAIKPTQNLWVRALGAHPPEKYVDGLLRMEERYDWVVIQQPVANPEQVGLAIISYGAQEALVEFSTCAVVGHHFDDRILAKAVNPVFAEIIQRAQPRPTETRQPEVAAQIDQHVDGLIAQLGRK